MSVLRWHRQGSHLRSDGLCDVAKGVDGCSSDCLLVGLQHIQQLEADPHPLTCRHKLVPSVSNAAHQVYTVLLHLRNRCRVKIRIQIHARLHPRTELGVKGECGERSSVQGDTLEQVTSTLSKHRCNEPQRIFCPSGQCSVRDQTANWEGVQTKDTPAASTSKRYNSIPQSQEDWGSLIRPGLGSMMLKCFRPHSVRAHHHVDNNLVVCKPGCVCNIQATWPTRIVA